MEPQKKRMDTDTLSRDVRHSIMVNSEGEKTEQPAPKRKRPSEIQARETGAKKVKMMLPMNKRVRWMKIIEVAVSFLESKIPMKRNRAKALVIINA